MTPKQLAEELTQSSFRIIQIDAINIFQAYLARKFRVNIQISTREENNFPEEDIVPFVYVHSFFPYPRFKYRIPINNTLSTGEFYIELCYFWRIFCLVEYFSNPKHQNIAATPPAISNLSAIEFATEFCKQYNLHLNDTKWVQTHFHLPEQYNINELLAELT